MKHKGMHITSIEMKVSVHDNTGKHIRGRLMTFRGTGLPHAIRNLLLYAKDHPECFPTGLIEANALLEPPWRLAELPMHSTHVPASYTKPKPKRPKKRFKLKRH